MVSELAKSTFTTLTGGRDLYQRRIFTYIQGRHLPIWFLRE